MKRLLSGAAIAVGLALSMGVLTALPAQAVTRPTPPPGTGWQFGLDVLTQMPRSCVVAPRYGGWDLRVAGSKTSAVNFGLVDRPIALRLSEPCFVPSGVASQPLGQALFIGADSTVFAIASALNSTQPGTSPWSTATVVLGDKNDNVDIGPNPNFTSITCASAAWSKPGSNQSTVDLTGGTSSFGGVQTPGASTYHYPPGGSMFTSLTTATNATTCKYIVRIDMALCWYDDGWDKWSVTPTLRTCMHLVWSADQYDRGNVQYEDSPQSGDQLNCLYNPAQADCAFITPEVDGASAVVCANAPPFLWSGDWTDFTWVPAQMAHAGTLVNHYARCLFVPVNGWDRNGTLADAWNASPGGEAAGLLADVAAGFELAGSCGVVVDSGSAPGLPGLVVDTCTWSWAAPWRTLLAVIVLGFFGFWAVGFVLSNFVSIVDRRGVTPLDGGDK